MSWLVVGSCAREHAILKKLKYDNKDIKLYCIGDNKNPGILSIVEHFSFFINFSILKLFCKKHKIKYAVVGPEKYISLGIVDFLEKNGIKCIGPRKAMGRIETNKFYARSLLKKNNLSSYNPIYKHFTSLNTPDKIQEYYNFCHKLNFSYVIKPTGLCSGKGVKVSSIHFSNDLEGLIYSLEIFKKNQTVMIEEKLEGTEFSLMSYSDGKYLSHMPVVTDFKLLEEGTGPNTGSMGCISYSNHMAPFLNESDIIIAKEINSRTVNQLNIDNKDLYKGILYGSYIKCNSGTIKLIEFNARYGDPECINCLELLESSLYDIYNSILNERLVTVFPVYSKINIVSKYLVPYFYPEKKDNVYEIGNIWYEENKQNIICSSVNQYKSFKYSTASRTLVYFATGNNIHKISNKINTILDIPNFKFRRDIGISKKSITYQESGVDIDKAQEIVHSMSPLIKTTLNINCMHNIGDYSGIIKIPDKYKTPVFISSIDGVGSKPSFLSKLTQDAYKIAGEDIVAHSINDILVKGADPFYFLDYIACEKLDRTHILDIIEGITRTCKKYRCPLLGGETAEMPNIYNRGEIDIAGCITGIVDKDSIIDGKKNINIDDHVIGLYSYGLHTNGFSLLRKVFGCNPPDKNFIEWVKQPHRCYYDEIKMLEGVSINAMVHITGGGLIDNPPRVLSDDKCMYIYKDYLLTHYFRYIQQKGNIQDEEMYRTLNCGIGFMIVLDEENYQKAKHIFHMNKIEYCRLGYIGKKTGEPVIFI